MSGTSNVVPFLNVSSLVFRLSSCGLSCGRKRRLDPGGRVGTLSREEEEEHFFVR